MASDQSGCEFDRAIAAHDAALAERGLEIWIGNEPTFTDRHSSASEWVNGALGDDKRGRAERLLAQLAAERPGCVVLRTIGRQYPDEAEPRWSYGIYALRDGGKIWSGPPDPLLATTAEPSAIEAFQAALEASLTSRGFHARGFPGNGDWRVVLTRDTEAGLPDPALEPRLLRPSIHAGPPPETGLNDDLARDGLLLLIVSVVQVRGAAVGCVELPAFGDTASFLRVLAAIADAARAGALGSLVLRGYPPPVDPTVRWATVTPDPAVVEVNMAPHGRVLDFLHDNRRCYASAAAAGLQPYRLHYNGVVADSGGGGQITFGGPLPARSPFFVHPHLLPRLIRYVQRHPSLSYLFAHDFIGGSGQSVRPDELGADALHELALALALTEREKSLAPGVLWQALAPSLTDAVGNSHRAEINIEKLWNPHAPERGQLGLVEFRAFRMQHTPERAAALATLVGAILAMLQARDPGGDLLDWGSTLHDRFALPFYLEADLHAVLSDLSSAGLALAPIVRAELETDRCRPWATLELGALTITIRRALEFWPLLGDASNQQGTSRLVDASTSRIEIVLRPAEGHDDRALAAVRVLAQGVDLPLRAERDDRGPVRVFGLRYRSFVPLRGMHPTLGAEGPLRLVLHDPAEPDALEILLHEWRPDGGAYDGLPADLHEAEERRVARCVVRRVADADALRARPAPRGAMTAWSLDLRYPPPPEPLAAPAAPEATSDAVASTPQLDLVE
jgi:uncharacterized protein (DUF2126 family)